jgi:hypothetical protein
MSYDMKIAKPKMKAGISILQSNPTQARPRPGFGKNDGLRLHAEAKGVAKDFLFC